MRSPRASTGRRNKGMNTLNDMNPSIYKSSDPVNCDPPPYWLNDVASSKAGISSR